MLQRKKKGGDGHLPSSFYFPMQLASNSKAMNIIQHISPKTAMAVGAVSGR